MGTDLFLVDKRALTAALPFTQTILSQVGRTLSKVQQALSWTYGEDVKPFKPPLNDVEFHTYLNHAGQLTRPEDLRLRIYHGGVEPSLRKVVWRYLLNVYPDGLSGLRRMEYMKCKTREYYQLKSEWKERCSLEDLDFIRGNVLKDVLRTDRTHPYYAGSEDSPHLQALHDLLATYAVTHPLVSYCQGMSDIASPILAVMDNEAHAFICFCGIMKRLEGNFRMDGECMSVKFSHLKLLLRHSDPDFYSYLVSRGADDLFFCYRWLLLELKREFAFEDALRMLEVTWSSLPPDPPEKEVELMGPPCPPGESVKTTQRRHMMRPDCGLSPEGEEEQEDRGEEKVEADASVITSTETVAQEGECITSAVQGQAVASCPLQKQASFGEFKFYGAMGEGESMEKELPLDLSVRASPHVRQSTEVEEEEKDFWEEDPLIKPPHFLGVTKSVSAPSLRSSSPTSQCPPSSGTGDHEAAPTEGENQWETPQPPAPSPVHISLPPPQEFGRGNPFMLFLCLSILLEHREHIMKQNMDYNELAMHFDRLVRRHNLNRALHRAKALFADYLQSKVWDSEEGDEAAAESPATS
ncbi:TBC1 domain family member 25 [Ascaphus truei]|uniref:TBC1 domain family member 25 n=1 Tax=Ascaphus truei TaxID=8439 RepID=UPI003F5A7504